MFPAEDGASSGARLSQRLVQRAQRPLRLSGNSPYVDSLGLDESYCDQTGNCEQGHRWKHRRTTDTETNLLNSLHNHRLKRMGMLQGVHLASDSRERPQTKLSPFTYS